MRHWALTDALNGHPVSGNSSSDEEFVLGSALAMLSPGFSSGAVRRLRLVIGVEIDAAYFWCGWWKPSALKLSGSS
jgi:hypothetical protein